MPNKDRTKRLEYNREYQRRLMASDPAFRARHHELVRAGKQRRKQQAQEIIAGFRANGCQYCDEREPCCLDAHHLDPATKDRDIGAMVSGHVGRDRLVDELKKCICICRNCHAKLHAGVLSLRGGPEVRPAAS